MKPELDLLTDFPFWEDLENRVASTVCDSILRRLPMSGAEARCVCRMYRVQHRFDVVRCGQDIDFSRLNFTTKGGVVTNVRCG